MNIMAAERPKRTISQPNYAELADLKIPRMRSVKKASLGTRGVTQTVGSQLCRLNVLERDVGRGLAKVRYVGYGAEFDEWRPMDDIIELSDGSSSDDQTVDGHSSGIFQCPTFERFCLLKELGYRIKSLLISNRKGDPNCRTIMPFDQVSFDSLVLCGSLATSVNSHCKRKIYTLANLSKLDDLLGERWHIRGLNTAGDFCYIIHNSVRFYLKNSKGKIDYQLCSDGTLVKKYFGKGYYLVFSFVRGDGVSSQWNETLGKSHM